VDRGQRAVLIVGMLVEAAEALAADVDVESVVCRSLAHGLRAEVAACFVPGSGAPLLTAHPGPGQVGGLVEFVEELRAADGPPVVLEHPLLGSVIVVAPPSFDHDEPGPRRALAFAKREGFGEHDVLLLKEAVPPLMALLPHAVAASERRARSRAGRDAAREFGLTVRELEVLELLSQGLLATSIASRLSLSPRTVHKHLGNIYDKLGVHDRLVAVSLARGRGLVAA
jgi:DNA-binding CsgD family transcriptional regulator